MEIKVLETRWERRLSYRQKEEPYEKWYPLPWGKMELKDVHISGQMYSSRGGASYWNLPDICIIGYGQYCPYVDFRFSGYIKVSSEENSKEDFGWRESDRRWVLLKGAIYCIPDQVCGGVDKKLSSTDETYGGSF